MKYASYLFLFSILTFVSKAQQGNYQMGSYLYDTLDRKDVIERGFTTTIKPYQFNWKDRTNNTGWGSFYENKKDVITYSDESLDLILNPIALIGGQFSNNDLDDQLFSYTRGVEAVGRIDKKLTFFSRFTENQFRFPSYVKNVTDSTLSIPYEGFWKQYNETGVDFLRAQGGIDLDLSKSIHAQFGYGKNFVGNGYRSLILSDYANNYPYLKLQTKTRIFDYTNLYAELLADLRGGTFGLEGSGSFSKKYMAFHHLNIKVKPNLHIGLFESVMFGDSTGGFQFSYLNPIIFYRAVEQQNGSEDNAFVGLDFKWNVNRAYSIYGQFMIDELIVSEFLSGDGWWGNKQGVQLGVKWFDPFDIEHLLIQAELNRVRPYMYAHEDGYTSYSHYNLALAHPLGANFTEYYGRVAYEFSEKLLLDVRLQAASYGNDIGDVNYGRDILKDYTDRVRNSNGQMQEFGVAHLQGNQTNLVTAFSRISYRVKFNIYLDADITIRNESFSSDRPDEQSAIFGLSLRVNAPNRVFLF